MLGNREREKNGVADENRTMIMGGRGGWAGVKISMNEIANKNSYSE